MPKQIEIGSLDKSLVGEVFNYGSRLLGMKGQQFVEQAESVLDKQGEQNKQLDSSAADEADNPSGGNQKTNNSETANGSEETQEKRDLSEDEVNEKQRAAIKEALERLARGEELTEKEKGNLCEMMMDQYYISQGYTPLHSPRVTSLDDKGHQGIDGVYQKGDHYVVSDAKFDQAQQKETQDGRQMSDTWIDRRLDESVGKEKAEEIRDAEEDGRVSHEIYHYDPASDEAGITYSDVHTVDENGNSNRDKHNVECYKDGERTNLTNGG